MNHDIGSVYVGDMNHRYHPIAKTGAFVVLPVVYFVVVRFQRDRLLSRDAHA